MADKITFSQGKINVPDSPAVPFIIGDGIGADIWPATKAVIDAAVEKAYLGKRQIAWTEVLAGEKAFAQTGEWLPQATLEAFTDHIIGIKGPLSTPVGGGIRSLNVALRQTLDLYVCLRPVRYFQGVPSPVRFPEKVNMCIFRENTEDIYAGIEFMAGTPEADKLCRFLTEEMGVSKIRFPESSSFGIKPVSREGSERLARSAFEYALRHHLPTVTLVHKGNIMKFTEGGFKQWAYALAEAEFGAQVFTMQQYAEIEKQHGRDAAASALSHARTDGKLIVNDCICDAFLQETLLHPEEYSVVATTNLNGDYISDQLAAMVGGIGISPGANINYRSGYAIFEATHGTAPSIAGRGLANPCSLILSAVMMLEYMGWDEAAGMVVSALEKTFKQRTVTSDMHAQMPDSKLVSTSEFGERVIINL